jgi:hypothetical protein
MSQILNGLMIVAMTAGVGSLVAFADENEGENKVKIEDVTDLKNKVPGADADDVLTNAKLRAESGSKSRFSVATQLDYDGGSLERPLAGVRPNIQGVTGDTAFADFNGQINAKYNITQLDSILVGGGLRWITPLQGSQKPEGYGGQMVDVFNPQINYQRIYKVGSVQSYVQVGPTLYTETNLVNEGYIANFGAYNVNAYDIGTSRFTIGMESQIAGNAFKPARQFGKMSVDAVKDDESDYNFFMYPYVEYKLSDKLNLRAVTFLVSFEHTRLHTMDTWRKDKVTQSFGLGISVTRDIFLYPNVQFVPDEVRMADTNVGLAANVNVF